MPTITPTPAQLANLFAQSKTPGTLSEFSRNFSATPEHVVAIETIVRILVEREIIYIKDVHYGFTSKPALACSRSMAAQVENWLADQAEHGSISTLLRSALVSYPVIVDEDGTRRQVYALVPRDCDHPGPVEGLTAKGIPWFEAKFRIIIQIIIKTEEKPAPHAGIQGESADTFRAEIEKAEKLFTGDALDARVNAIIAEYDKEKDGD